jgi:hypothetical protein
MEDHLDAQEGTERGNRICRHKEVSGGYDECRSSMEEAQGELPFYASNHVTYVFLLK